MLSTQKTAYNRFCNAEYAGELQTVNSVNCKPGLKTIRIVNLALQLSLIHILYWILCTIKAAIKPFLLPICLYKNYPAESIFTYKIA